MGGASFGGAPRKKTERRTSATPAGPAKGRQSSSQPPPLLGAWRALPLSNSVSVSSRLAGLLRAVLDAHASFRLFDLGRIGPRINEQLHTVTT
jgi:hypothetical protein